MKPFFRITFYLSDKRHFDYYKNLLHALRERGEEPLLILNDTRSLYGGTELPEGYTQEMISLAEKSGFSFRLSSELLNEKKRYPLIVSTFAYYYKVPYGSIRLKSLLIRLISLLLFKLPLLKRVLQKPGWISDRIRMAAQTNNYHRSSDYPEHLHATYTVFYPKGLDISEESPPEVIRNLPDLFFCHGPYDQKVIEKNSGKEVIAIGYPRYDSLSETREVERARIVEEFGLDPDKPLVTWLPTYAKDGRNLNEWADLFTELAEEVNVILRPHPKLTDGNGDHDHLKQFRKSNIYIDSVAQRDMTDLYGASDVVCCDYGGTIFSALYTETSLILLDLSDHEAIATRRKTSSDIVVRKKLFHLSAREASLRGGLPAILKDPDLRMNQKEIQREVRNHYFGEHIPGESSLHAAESLIRKVEQL